MGTLRHKGYSFGDVAKWMSERLGAKITRSQVAYVLTAPDEVLDADAEAEALEHDADQLSEAHRLGEAITNINGQEIRE